MLAKKKGQIAAGLHLSKNFFALTRLDDQVIGIKALESVGEKSLGGPDPTDHGKNWGFIEEKRAHGRAPNSHHGQIKRKKPTMICRLPLPTTICLLILELVQHTPDLLAPAPA